MCIAFAIATLNVAAQNLVPNPSFEDTSACPDFAAQVWRAEGWYTVENTPDYFHACCTGQLAAISVPCNAFTCRYAATGNAYCGVWTYGHIPELYREYLGIQLTSPLTIGVQYYVSFKLSSVSSHAAGSNGGNDKTGILFSCFKYDLNNLPPMQNFSQVYADSIITDTVGWTQVTGSFVADSNYQYITLGNFYTDSFTNSILYYQINGEGRLAYYFVDDVCVTTDSKGCDFTNGLDDVNVQIPFSIYPNPANDVLNITLNSVNVKSLALYNSQGHLEYMNKAVAKKDNYQIELKDFPQGIYLLEVNLNQKILSQKILIFHQ